MGKLLHENFGKAACEVVPENFEIYNFATGQRAVTDGSKIQITLDKNYENILKSEADAIIFSFGSNDGNDANWVNQKTFEKSYIKIAKDLIGVLGGDVNRFFLMTGPPHCADFDWWTYDGPMEVHDRLCNVDIPLAMPKIKAALSLPQNNYIDMFTLLGGSACDRPEFFCQ